MRHLVTLAADHADFVRLERHRTIELAYGRYNHTKSVNPRSRIIKTSIYSCADFHGWLMKPFREPPDARDIRTNCRAVRFADSRVPTKFRVVGTRCRASGAQKGLHEPAVGLTAER
jgi:hypothetical protein